MNEWKVCRNPVGDKVRYGVYRRVSEGVDHSGSREEYPGMFDSRAIAQQVADRMNKIEGGDADV